jgi:hypothetical protein
MHSWVCPHRPQQLRSLHTRLDGYKSKCVLSIISVEEEHKHWPCRRPRSVILGDGTMQGSLRASGRGCGLLGERPDAQLTLGHAASTGLSESAASLFLSSVTNPSSTHHYVTQYKKILKNLIQLLGYLLSEYLTNVTQIHLPLGSKHTLSCTSVFKPEAASIKVPDPCITLRVKHPKRKHK